MDAQGHDHIVYLNDQAHLGGTNYVMADGHAGMKLQTTMYVDHWMWGKRAYSCGGGHSLNGRLSPLIPNLMTWS